MCVFLPSFVSPVSIRGRLHLRKETPNRGTKLFRVVTDRSRDIPSFHRATFHPTGVSKPRELPKRKRFRSLPDGARVVVRFRGRSVSLLQERREAYHSGSHNRDTFSINLESYPGRCVSLASTSRWKFRLLLWSSLDEVFLFYLSLIT